MSWIDEHLRKTRKPPVSARMLKAQTVLMLSDATQLPADERFEFLHWVLATAGVVSETQLRREREAVDRRDRGSACLKYS